jgi:hypothetical protein
MKVKMIVITNNSSNGDGGDDKDDRKENYRRRCIRGEKSGAIDEKRDRNPQTDTYCCCPC